MRISDLCGEKFESSVSSDPSWQNYRANAPILRISRCSRPHSRRARATFSSCKDRALSQIWRSDWTKNSRGIPHYAYCRRLGQLRGARHFPKSRATLASAYLRRCVAMGQRAGAVKTVALHRLTAGRTSSEASGPNTTPNTRWKRERCNGYRAARHSPLPSTLAERGDDAELRALLRENPMNGFDAGYLRARTRLFLGMRHSCPFHQVGVGRDLESGRIVGLGTRSIAHAFVNGRPVPFGWLSDLRLQPA